MKKNLLINVCLLVFISLLLSSCPLLALPFIEHEINNNANSSNNRRDSSGESYTNGANQGDGYNEGGTEGQNNNVKKNVFKMSFSTGTSQRVYSRTEATERNYFTVNSNVFTCFDYTNKIINMRDYVFVGWSLDPKYNDTSFVDSDDFSFSTLASEETKTFFSWNTDPNKCKAQYYLSFASREAIDEYATEYSLKFYGVWVPNNKFYSLRPIDSNFNEVNVEAYDDFIYYEIIPTDFSVYAPKELIIPPILNNEYVRAISDLKYGKESDELSITLPYALELFYPNLYNKNICKITVDSSNSYFAAIDDVLYNKEKDSIYFFPCKKNADGWVLPETVDTIESRAFSYANIQYIDLDNIKKIGPGAFRYSNLRIVHLPSNVEFTENNIFNFRGKNFIGCNKLMSVIIYENNKLTSLPEYMFCDCTELRNIDIRTNLTSAGQYVFCNCINLKEIKYHGSKEQWKNIRFGADSFLYDNNITINCSDGQLYYSK